MIIHHTAVSLHLSEQTGMLSVCMDMSVLMAFFHLAHLKKSSLCESMLVSVCHIRCSIFFPPVIFFFFALFTLFFSVFTQTDAAINMLLFHQPHSVSPTNISTYTRTHTHTTTQAYIPEAQRQGGYCNKHLKKCWSNK